MSFALVASALAWTIARGPSVIAIAVVLFECLRAAISLTTQVATLGASSAFFTGFGELRYGVRALGGPHIAEVVTSWVEFLIPWVVLSFLISRRPVGERLWPAFAVTALLLLGLVLWLGWLGPRVLPSYA